MSLTGDAVMLPMDGTMLVGAVIVNPCVLVPSTLPLASSVSNVALAEPLVADGIALSHVSGMV